MHHTVPVTDATFRSEVEHAAGLTVVDFWAEWCGPCRIIAPFLEDIAAQRTGAVKVAKLNTDENPQTTARFNVRSMPTLLFFKGGQVVGQIMGAVPRNRIEDAIAQYA
jgi:thioredoxin 1